MTATVTDQVSGDRIVRFDAVERSVHWVSSSLVLVTVATGLVLYVAPLAAAVGNRELVKNVHVIAGLAAFVPVVAALAGPWGRGLRRDVSRFANWHRDDVRWFSPRWRDRCDTGKFNGGQKLNAVLVAAGLVVMAMSGAVMKWFAPFPLSWRSGATFVHDWVSFGLWILIAVHVVKAVATPGALRGMVTGTVPVSDARAKSRWWASVSRRR